MTHSLDKNRLRKARRYTAGLMHPPLLYKQARGITLIELLAALGIAATLMAMAVPSFRSFTLNNRMVAEFNNFTSALQLARSEAIRRNENVSVCTSNDGQSCSASANWEDGWIICVEAECGTPTGVLRFGEALPDEYSLRASTSFNSASVITFSNDGTLANDDGRGAFTLCDSRAEKQAKIIIVNAVGRTQRGFDDDSDDIVDDHDGENAVCPT